MLCLSVSTARCIRRAEEMFNAGGGVLMQPTLSPIFTPGELRVGATQAIGLSSHPETVPSAFNHTRVIKFGNMDGLMMTVFHAVYDKLSGDASLVSIMHVNISR